MAGRASALGGLSVGLGDQVLATGLARGAAARGKRIAFGDGRRIIWDGNSPEVFKGNPNIAPPGSEFAGDLEWIGFYKGSRIYNRHDVERARWLWNYDFKATPGEVFFTAEERGFARSVPSGAVVIEPNVPRFKSIASNKDWGGENYQKVAALLSAAGVPVVQLDDGRTGTRLELLPQIKTPTFRQALAVLSRSALYIGPEGGLHHGAAAVGVPGVVLFGGFIPPQVTGYATHTNLTGGAAACGSLLPCEHCRDAMEAITVDDVLAGALGHLKAIAA